eukprot:4300229-Pyramimonas_sp.AAC.1
MALHGRARRRVQLLERPGGDAEAGLQAPVHGRDGEKSDRSHRRGPHHHQRGGAQREEAVREGGQRVRQSVVQGAHVLQAMMGRKALVMLVNMTVPGVSRLK